MAFGNDKENNNDNIKPRTFNVTIRIYDDNFVEYTKQPNNKLTINYIS